jgi:hypothetical protein
MILRNVNLYDLTCMQNFEVALEVVYGLLWIIFKEGFEFEFILKQGLQYGSTVDTW